MSNHHGEVSPPSSEARRQSPTRRALLLGGAAASLSIAAVGGYAVGNARQDAKSPPDSDTYIRLDLRTGDQLSLIKTYDPRAQIEPRASNRYLEVLTNKNYLRQVLQELRNSRAGVDTAQDAIPQSLRIVRTSSNPADISGYATAWQIDKGGIYITARHVVKEAFDTFVNPYTNEPVTVADSFIHPTADIAIVVAPTGLPPEPDTNNHIATAMPKPGDTLQMTSLLPWGPGLNRQPEVYLYQKSGIVSQAQPDRIAVAGLIPLGGTSGSPIIDSNTGAIVGVESSLFYRDPNGPDGASNYAGAIITPTLLLDDLLS